MLRIDTSGEGVIFGALLNKVQIRGIIPYCISSDSQIVTLSIDVINDEIKQQVSVETCDK